MGKYSTSFGQIDAPVYKNCQIKKCTLKVHGYGLCVRHYSNCKNYGFPLPRRGDGHGLSHKISEYTAWCNMRSRCYKKTNKAYGNYGGRGIRVCDKWNKSFVAFYEDMGDKPTPDHSLDRVDVNGDYEPGNCRWATAEVQANNKRMKKTNKSGYENIHQRSDNKKWVARSRIDSKRHYLGQFDTIEEAFRAQSDFHKLNRRT